MVCGAWSALLPGTGAVQPLLFCALSERWAEEGAHRSVLDAQESEKHIDADESEDDSEESDSSESEGSGEESDNEEEMLKELEKIKKERLEEQQRSEMERVVLSLYQALAAGGMLTPQQLHQQEEEQSRSLLNSNPLIVESEDFSVKKKWWEDSVFRNQAKQPKLDTKTFINDSTRNHFHRKFLEKYIV